jgi:hypothetical protein
MEQVLGHLLLEMAVELCFILSPKIAMWKTHICLEHLQVTRISMLLLYPSGRLEEIRRIILNALHHTVEAMKLVVILLGLVTLMLLYLFFLDGFGSIRLLFEKFVDNVAVTTLKCFVKGSVLFHIVAMLDTPEEMDVRLVPLLTFVVIPSIEGTVVDAPDFDVFARVSNVVHIETEQLVHWIDNFLLEFISGVEVDTFLVFKDVVCFLASEPDLILAD